MKKLQDTLIDNLKGGIDLAKDILQRTPDSNFRKGFKYIGETLKTAHSIALEAQSSTRQASLSHIEHALPAIIVPAHQLRVRLRHQPLLPVNTEETTGESQGKKGQLRKLVLAKVPRSKRCGPNRDRMSLWASVW